MFESIAYAQTAAGAGVGGEGGNYFLLLIQVALIFMVFYFLLIRPQQKKAQSLKQMLEALKKGDKVVTAGGVIGTVTAMAQDTVTLQVADNVKIKVTRESISGIRKPEEEPASEK